MLVTDAIPPITGPSIAPKIATPIALPINRPRAFAGASAISHARPAVHEHELAVGVRRELSEMVRSLLDEVERGLETTDTNGHASGGHEESPPVRGAE